METSVNNKCKVFTSLEQSKKLAEILPVESADMWWVERKPVYYLSFTKPSEENYSQDTIKDIPCWSLAALLEQLDAVVTDEYGNDYTLVIIKEGLQYQLYYRDSWGEVEDIETDYYDDMVDACVEMVLKLKEKGLL